MRRLLIGVGIAMLAIGGPLAGWVIYMLNEIATGLPNLDALRMPLIKALALHALATPEHGRAMMAILHNEHTNGDPAHDIGTLNTKGPTNPMAPGDLNASGGPSVGPGQVYYSTAVDLGIWSGDKASYLAFGTDPANLSTLIDWAVQVYKAKLKIADAEIASGKTDPADRIPRAIELYNGAKVYEDNALAFEAQVYGGSTS